MKRHLTCALIGALALSLSACVTTGPASNQPASDLPPERVEDGGVSMPSRFNTDLLRVIDEGRRVRIYTTMNNIGDGQNKELLFPARVAQQLGLTNGQMNRRFMDLLISTRRFIVFDGAYTGGVEAEAQQQWGEDDADIVVDARQETIDISPYRKIRTQVKVSVHMINRLTGQNLFDGDVAVSGTWGDVQGEGTMLSPSTDINGASIQQSLGSDYERALSKAFAEAVERIEQIVRPVGRVTYTDETNLSMFGGIQHGFQRADDVVIFRAIRREGEDRIIGVKPIALARCQGVGSDISQCDLVRRRPGEAPKDGDYVVLTDESARKRRER